MPPSSNKLDRIEEKVNTLAEHMAAARTDIAWLKNEYARHTPSSSNGGRSKLWANAIEAVKVLGSALIAYLTLILTGGGGR